MSASQDHALMELVDSRAQMVMGFVDDDLEQASLLENHEDVVMDADVMRAAGLRQVPKGLLLVIGAGSLLLLGLAASLTRAPEARHRAKVDESVELGAVGSMLSVITAGSHGMQLLGAIGTGMEDGEKIVWDAINVTAHHDLEVLTNYTDSLLGLHGEELAGDNHMHDGNPCPDNEEEFGGLCYQKCADLTHGEHPIRTTAFSCCASEPCNAFNSVFTNPVKFCQGLDVGGRSPGYGCPHSHGDCLLNEEFHLGECYKKCLLLTNADYPYRRSADSCCKVNNYWGCLVTSNVLTNATFDVGGGGGDEVYEAEASMVHAPIPALAEAQTTTPALTFGAIGLAP